MNYLAHFFLADSNPDLMFGNYIGDGVKGSDLSRFPVSIQRGISFHRFIDTFTDTHSEVAESKKLFYPTQSKFSGVVVDVMFDHLLALEWNRYHEQSLGRFATKCYQVIEERKEWLPPRSERFYIYMVGNNILANYARIEGIERVFRGMDSRTKFDSNMLDAVNLSEHDLEQLQEHFERFFPVLIEACNQWRVDN